MTFEATDTRAHTTAAEETIASAARPSRRPARQEHPAETMVDYAVYGEVVATRLRGLAALFRGVFCDEDVSQSDDALAAADIIYDVMKTIADGLDASADRARTARDRLIHGEAR